MEKPDSCINYRSSLDRDGYGVTIINGKNFRVHRLVYLLFRGDPGNYLVCHSCDNPSCINIDHLFLGTNDDNINDMLLKNRQRNQYKNTNYCIQGHEFSESNTYINPSNGSRQCRICKREYNRNYKRKDRK